jgi:hypothetical protein
MAIPLIAAYATVSAGIAAGGFIGGMMIAGGAMTAMGALSGDKDLSRWGGLLSLAGGVAGMANGSWATTADSAASASATADDAAMFSNIEYGGAAETAVSDAAFEAAFDAAAGTPGAAQTMGDDLGFMVADQAPVTAAPSTLATAPSSAPPTSATAPVTPTATAQAAAPTTIPVDPAAAQTTVPSAAGSEAVPGKFDGLLNSVKGFGDYIANPKNARVVQAGSGLLQAGLSAYGKQDEVRTQLKMQEDAQARARARLNASLVGLKMPVYQSAAKQG